MIWYLLVLVHGAWLGMRDMGAIQEPKQPSSMLLSMKQDQDAAAAIEEKRKADLQHISEDQGAAAAIEEKREADLKHISEDNGAAAAIEEKREADLKHISE